MIARAVGGWGSQIGLVEAHRPAEVPPSKSASKSAQQVSSASQPDKSARQLSTFDNAGNAPDI